MKFFSSTALIVFVALAMPMLALAAGDHKGEHHKDAATAGATAMTEGEVRKVDKDSRKITVKHGEIKNLDMPPMTMVFQVKDAALLEKVKAGDKILFSAEKAGSGIAITAIELAK